VNCGALRARTLAWYTRIYIATYSPYTYSLLYRDDDEQTSVFLLFSLNFCTMFDLQRLQAVNAASEIVTEPRDNDVLLGKGYRCREHCGTKHFHRIVRNHVEAYRSAKAATEKGTIAEDILSSITTLDPPGRFLREVRSDERRNEEQPEKEDDADEAVKPAPSCCWVVLDNAVVLKKVKQALRDSSRTPHNKASSAAAAAAAMDGPRPLQPILPRPPLPPRVQADPPSVKQLFQDLGVLRKTPPLQATSLARNSRAYTVEKRNRDEEDQLSGNQKICLPSMFSPLNDEEIPGRDEEDAANQLLALLMSNETQTPPFSEQDAQREQASMTEDEKVAAISDLFGSLCEVGPDTTKRIRSDSVDALLAEMRRAVADIPQEQKSALLLAMKRASPREFDNDRLRLFLNREAMNPTVRIMLLKKTKRSFACFCYWPLTNLSL
jgi:hypothetical protein